MPIGIHERGGAGIWKRRTLFLLFCQFLRRTYRTTGELASDSRTPAAELAPFGGSFQVRCGSAVNTLTELFKVDASVGAKACPQGGSPLTESLHTAYMP